jgi:simple sugar transport system permease protein
MVQDLLVSTLSSCIVAATPLVIAGLGELVVERSGVLNLGIEGMMAVGAVVGFAFAHDTRSVWTGVAMAMVAGTLLALAFGVATLTLLADQAATGLALTIFGLGLSAFIGKHYESMAVAPVHSIAIPLLDRVPILGRILFDQQSLVYLSWGLFAAVQWFLMRSRWGLVLRAVGESPLAAHDVGYPVIAIRFAAVAFGGAMAGVAGAFLSEFYTPLWVEGMVAGRGWIAGALVVFATWRPVRLMVGAYLFGFVMVAALFVQASGARIAIPSQWLNSLPYWATILVLVLISRDKQTIRLNSPASLGSSFRVDG